MACTKARVIGSTALVKKNLRLPLLPDESQRTLQDLKPTHDDVEIHAVDGFQLQNNVLA
jgi:hypothetical protein